jgi:hypothetical protein
MNNPQLNFISSLAGLITQSIIKGRKDAYLLEELSPQFSKDAAAGFEEQHHF